MIFKYALVYIFVHDTSRYNMCPHTRTTYPDISLTTDQRAQYLLSKRLTPTRWFGRHRTHAHTHITRTVWFLVWPLTIVWDILGADSIRAVKLSVRHFVFEIPHLTFQLFDPRTVSLFLRHQYPHSSFKGRDLRANLSHNGPHCTASISSSEA